MMRNLITILIVSIMLFGCAPTHVFGFKNATAKVYKGEVLPDDKISIIKGDIRFVFGGNVYIERIDSHDLVERYYIVDVLPGDHSVGILYVGSISICFFYVCTKEYFRCNTNFQTEAGNKYKIYKSTESSEYNVFVKNVTTGEVIHKTTCRVKRGYS